MHANLLLSLFFHSWTVQDLAHEMVLPVWRVGVSSYKKKKTLRGTCIKQADLNNPYRHSSQVILDGVKLTETSQISCVLN